MRLGVVRQSLNFGLGWLGLGWVGFGWVGLGWMMAIHRRLKSGRLGAVRQSVNFGLSGVPCLVQVELGYLSFHFAFLCVPFFEVRTECMTLPTKGKYAQPIQK